MSTERAALRPQRFWRTSTFRQAMISSAVIWIATALVATAMHFFTRAALVNEVTGEINERIKLRTAGLQRLTEHDASPTQWLYSQFVHKVAVLTDCVMLIDADGEVQLSNLSLAPKPAFRYREYYTAEHTGYRWRPGTDAGPNTCLVRDIQLADGGTLIYGGPFDSYYTIIERLDTLLFWGLLISGGISCLIGFALSLRSIIGIRKINRVCDLVAEGDLRQRIPLKNTNDDLERLAASINHMLDQINQLMDGIRQVSDSIAHDLKTPLAHVRNRLELLLEAPERSDSDVQAIIDEADRLLSSFNALLRISQLDQGTTRQAFRDFDFREVLNICNDMYALVFADKSIAFHIDIADGDFPVFGDRDLWLQAVSNLLDNAYKYCPAGGEVTLLLQREGDQLRLVVRDSGPGIPEAEQGNVFKRFYRLEKHRGQSGTGLGLSLVASVCKVHQAEVQLHNDNGLVVTLLLPLKRS